MARLVKGDKFPDFKVNTILGNELKEGLTIKEITGGKPTMFWFLRYMGCPPCRLDVHLLTVKKPEFDAKGVNIVVAMQSKPEIVLRDMIEKHCLSTLSAIQNRNCTKRWNWAKENQAGVTQ